MDNLSPAPTHETGLLREPQVLDLVKVSSATLRRLWQRNEFPQPHKLGRVNVWRAEDVRAFLEALSGKTK